MGSTIWQPPRWVWKRQEAAFSLKPGRVAAMADSRHKTQVCLNNTQNWSYPSSRACCVRHCTKNFTRSILIMPWMQVLLLSPHYAETLNSFLKVIHPVSGRVTSKIWSYFKVWLFYFCFCSCMFLFLSHKEGERRRRGRAQQHSWNRLWGICSSRFVLKWGQFQSMFQETLQAVNLRAKNLQ